MLALQETHTVTLFAWTAKGAFLLAWYARHSLSKEADHEFGALTELTGLETLAPACWARKQLAAQCLDLLTRGLRGLDRIGVGFVAKAAGGQKVSCRKQERECCV